MLQVASVFTQGSHVPDLLFLSLGQVVGEIIESLRQLAQFALVIGDLERAVKLPCANSRETATSCRVCLVINKSPNSHINASTPIIVAIKMVILRCNV